MLRSVAVVVSADGRPLLEENLPSLTEQSLAFDRIIVVDNGSQDGSECFCRSLPGVEALILGRNLGFPGGVNQGLMSALADPSVDQIALVNNDVRLHPDWHAEASRALRSHFTYGSVATCLLKADRPDVVDSAGIIWAAPGRPENYHTSQPASLMSSEPQEIFGASAGAALYRRAFFDTVGLFDESLFAYQEDVDLALRGQAAGWRCVLAPAARGWHTGFGSNRPFPLGGSRADFLNSRNRLAVLVQSLPSEEWRRHWSTILTNELHSVIRSPFEGRGLAVVAGLCNSLWWLRRRLKRRREQIRIGRITSSFPLTRPHESGWSRLSVGLIVKDALRLLPGALATVPQEAELLVADGGSRDGSERLAKAAGAMVVYQDPLLLAAAGGNFDRTRNQLTAMATREWILFLDADERLSPSLRAEITDLLNTQPSAAAYDIPRINCYWGRPVRLLGEDRQVRLLRCSQCRWLSPALHQPPVVAGHIDHLRSPLLHHNITSWRDVTVRFRRYLPVEVRTRAGPPDMVQAVALPWRFFRYYYFHQKAWRDGFRGLVVTLIYTVYQTATEWGAKCDQGKRKVLSSRE